MSGRINLVFPTRKVTASARERSLPSKQPSYFTSEGIGDLTSIVLQSAPEASSATASPTSSSRIWQIANGSSVLIHQSAVFITPIFDYRSLELVIIHSSAVIINNINFLNDQRHEASRKARHGALADQDMEQASSTVFSSS